MTSQPYYCYTSPPKDAPVLDAAPEERYELSVEEMIALSTDVRTAHGAVVEYLTLRQMAHAEFVRWRLIREGLLHE